MESFFRDLRQSLRMFAASPAFTLAAIAALTLGIGANTALVLLIGSALLIRWLPTAKGRFMAMADG